MAGGPAYLLLRPVVPVQPVSAFKFRRIILSPLPKFTCKFRVSLQSPRENPLFAQKTHELSDRVRHPQKKIQGAIEDRPAGAEAEDLPARAEAVLPYIVGKLVNFIANEGKLLVEVHDDLKWIKKELEYMQCFLEDAYSKQKTDEKVGKLVAEIRDVSYEVEDAIDTFIYSQQRRRGFIEYIKRHFMEPKTHNEVAKQIKVIKQKISDISRRRETYGIRDINEGRPESSLQIRRRFLALLEDPEVVGLQDEIKKVKELLNRGEPSRCVVSIVGMGGSGKTTLAKKVYNAVKDDFECRAFICLSQQYKIEDVLMGIIERVMGPSVEEKEKLEKLEVEVLEKKLADHLREKRYLVVVDDVWSVEAWDTLKHVLPDGMKKSRVILTTRNREVALHAGTSSPLHKIEKRLLDGNEGWELFLKTVFQGENPPTACLSELHETGTKIFAKSRGLPLAILVLASLLSRKRINAWSKVLETEYPHLTESPEDYVGIILAVSYWDLPAHLKPCFLYLGLFPEDNDIDLEKLIRLWIAEGFIQQRDDDTMEDVAEDYLEELVDRSMVQASRERPDGPVVKCRIHDLFRRLSISKAKQHNFFTIHNVDATSSFSTSSRRMALHRNINRYHPTAALRSILSFCNSNVSHSEFSRAKFLRVVSQGYMPTPKEVREFVLLRYLELSKSQSLLSSIGDLYNLQTLILNQSDSPLPKAISNLEQLRHLEAPNSYVKDFSINKLTNLKTLRLGAGNWIEHGFGKLTNLRKLEITGNTDPYNEALSDSIDKLKNLRSLSLDSRWSYHPLFMPFRHHLHLYQMSLIGRMKKLPEFPPNLAELTLAHCHLDQDAISILEKLPHLQILILGSNSYVSKKMICTSGGFLQLETLTLREFPLEEWIVEEGAMPSLKSVILCNMDNLNPQTLPNQIRDMLKLV